MAAPSTVDDLKPILKSIYAKLGNSVLYKNHPFLAMITKKDDFGGEDLKVPLQYSPEPGGSAEFSAALSNRGPAGHTRFSVTRKKDYAIGSLSTELLRAATGANEHALVSSMTTIIKGLQNTQSRALALAAFRNGGGARAQVASGMASDTITLVNKKDIVWFERGMVLDGSANDGLTGVVTSGAAAARIVAVDRDAGTIKNNGSANWNAATGINGLSANWYLFRQGDFGKTLVGLDGWIPAVVNSTPFNGVDRTVDGERTAGCRITPTTDGYSYSTIEGAVEALLERVYVAGGAPDRIFMHPSRYRRLGEELGARKVYTDKVPTKEAGISFGGYIVEGQGGPCHVVSDPCCQKDVIWALTMDSWCLHTLGGVMSVNDDAGTDPWIKEHDADAIQFRLITMGDFVCDAPAWNGRASVAGIA